MTAEQVNHPAHYTQGAIECIDAIEAALTPAEFQAFCRGQGIKYNWRAGRKGDSGEDMEKAAWYGHRGAASARKEQAALEVSREAAYADQFGPSGSVTTISAVTGAVVVLSAGEEVPAPFAHPSRTPNDLAGVSEGRFRFAPPARTNATGDDIPQFLQAPSGFEATGT